MDETQHTPVPAPTAKKSGFGKYVMIAILVLVVGSFAVESLAAWKEGRSINLELLNKLLDTLISLMDASSAE